MPATLVSVVVINYNTFKLTSACIESIYTYTKGVSIEVILVDNHSSECDPDEFKNRFPQITLIKNPENSGFAKGNNVGIMSATGDYILLLNSDTELKNDAITIVHQFLERHHSVAVASARLQYPSGIIQHNCQRFPSVRAKLFELFRLQKFTGKMGERVLFGPFFKYDAVAFPDWVWGTFFMFQKSLLNKLPNKKLAETFFMYGEDMEWCMEFKKLGLKIGFIPDAHVVHHLGKSGGKANAWMQQNHTIFLNQYYSKLHQLLLRGLDKLLAITNRNR